jgi:hypothetical protein
VRTHSHCTAAACAACLSTFPGKEVNGKSLYAGRAQKKAEREAMLRSQFEEKRAERLQKYQVRRCGLLLCLASAYIIVLVHGSEQVITACVCCLSLLHWLCKPGVDSVSHPL